MQRADAAIRDLILEFECQPILFVGSGISQRYFGAPSWRDLLRHILNYMPNGADHFEYLRQKHDDDPVAIGTHIAGEIFEWAWRDGRKHFPPEFYERGVNQDVFVKFLACQYIRQISVDPDAVDESLKDEVAALSEIKPHAIITTNYDLFLESVFEGYETITGQTILKYNTNSFGEIFHIHGDISDPSTIVLTGRDYADWTQRKKYIAAKLLTYFAEHPIFIIGYGLGDPNIKELLRDIGELVADESGLIRNVYQIIWQQEQLDKSPPEQAIFAVDGKEYRTMAVHTNEFEWIFKALRSQSALSSINPKLVRALAARMMRLIRHDIPSGSVAVDYDVLERVAENIDELPKLLGITSIENPNLSHPFTITQLAHRIGLRNWQAVNLLIHDIKAATGIDLRSTDNRYHCQIKTGSKSSSIARKWSYAAVDLFTRVSKREAFELML